MQEKEGTMKKLILLSILLLSNCKLSTINQNTININEKTIHEATLVAVGDNLIHQTIYNSSYENNKYNFKPIYENMKPFIKNHDIAFVNQETILGSSELGLSTYPRFNSPTEVGDALVDAGFNLISLANNHTLDRGEEAIKNSISYWNRQSVIYSGSEINNTPRIKRFTDNYISFAFVAYTYGTNGINIPEGKTHLVNCFSYESAKSDILSVRDEVDVVIVSMHWGNEYHNEPSETQIEQAKFLSTLGVDIILGHHPHVIEPFEVITIDKHKTYVVYSLGNFLSDQIGIDRLIGMAFSLDITKQMNEVMIQHPKAKLFYTYKYKNQFKNIFFNDLDESILPGYKKIFLAKKELIQSLDDQIEVS